MTLLDRGIGLAVRNATGGLPQATLQLNVSFVSAGQIGEFIHTEAVVTQPKRSVVFAAGTALAGDRIVATAQGVWKVLGA